MLLLIITGLVILWLIGFLVIHITVWLIHLLLVIALIVLIVKLIKKI